MARALRRFPCRSWWKARSEPHPGQYLPVSASSGQGGNTAEVAGSKTRSMIAAAMTAASIASKPACLLLDPVISRSHLINRFWAGHGFSRAAQPAKRPALAPEGTRSLLRGFIRINGGGSLFPELRPERRGHRSEVLLRLRSSTTFLRSSKPVGLRRRRPPPAWHSPERRKQWPRFPLANSTAQLPGWRTPNN